MSDYSSSKVQAGEISYELHSLGWKAFQNLCLTIMGEVWGQEVQGFFDTHDGGRDGAFYGTWRKKTGGSLQGAFSAQCKFTAKPDKRIRLSDLRDDIKKAKRLAERGLADNYVLFTNAQLTGLNEEKIRQAFESIPEVKKFAVIGCERISQYIREHPRLRMLVPRVYGLGDLSQILDERAYQQAREILSALGDDLAKLVVTDAYTKGAKALNEEGFVLLLGEPACGKSMIAATLAISALDKWGCFTVKVRDADDFVKHFNPNERQFLWVDDAFGSTHIDFSCTVAWNQAFPHLHAAIRRGSKVCFTSRNYIYSAARHYLKESALPVIKESQVVIHVEDLTESERESILYNHIRLGTQPKAMKTKLKPFLPDIAAHNMFTPEIARRLGCPEFTKELEVSKRGLDNFVASPMEFLREIIYTLDDGCRSALAMVFMRGGMLSSPVQMTDLETQAISRLGSSIADVLKALKSLEGSFIRCSLQGSRYAWYFKHPTIRDAYSEVIAEDLEMMEIYLTGAPLDKLLAEVSCGNAGVVGAKVIVPPDQYDSLIARLDSVDTNKYINQYKLKRFLSYRCDRQFLQRYVERHPGFITQNKIEAYLEANPSVSVLARLHEYGLLPEAVRGSAVEKIRELAIDVPDSGFLRGEIRRLMTDDEYNHILESIVTVLIPNLENVIDVWRENYSSDDAPDVYFDSLKSALQEYNNVLEDNEQASWRISDALAKIDSVIEQLWSEYPEEPDGGDLFNGDSHDVTQDSTRSIFEDVDE